MVGAIDQAQGELAVGAGPTLIGLPDVVVLAPAVGQPLVGGDGLLNLVDRDAGAAGNLLGDRVASGQDVEPLVST